MDFSEKYIQYDQQEDENLKFKRELEAKLQNGYLTFYEELLLGLRLGPLTFSVLFTVVLFLLHLGAAVFEEGADPDTIVEDFSYFLSFLNGVGLYLLFNATEKLRDFIINLVLLTKDRNKKGFYLNIYKGSFIRLRAIYYGFFFGVVNLCLASIFGIYYLERSQYFLLSTFLLQIFTIGFIGGVTVCGTMVVVRLIKSISIKDDINLAYFYPDKCAGTLVIGNILFLFSVHFIIIGILIFLFIHNFNWSNQTPGSYYVNALILFWKIFPFLLSGIIFFLPVRKINGILREYKIFEQLRIRRRMNYLTNVIMSFEPDKEHSKEKIDILDNHFQKLVQIDQQIGELNTWPYNLRYRATFLSIFLPVLIGIILELSKKAISSLFS